jgi:SNF2 family DNA or RNA helicase
MAHRVKPPPQVPLSERLHSLLQPPVTALLDDPRLWLPAEPFGFQLEGIQFLTSRWAALLADEMGLGKTMQAIVAVRLLLRAGQIRCCLVVCPKPLVTNWLREFDRWAEEIPVAALDGDAWIRRHRWLHDPRPVKLASYESLLRDEELLAKGCLRFDLVVLDEAQRIKNRDSKTASAVRRLKRGRSWALTGTPVENRPAELANLLEFVHNRRLPDDAPPDQLKDALGGVLLRRTKQKVIGDLPSKRVHDAFIDLGPNQRESYACAEKDGVFRLNHLGSGVTIEHVFDLIRRLKQICNFDPVTGESAKAEFLSASLEEIIESDGKAIVFSQWVTTLERLAAWLTGFYPLLFHGQVPMRRREEVLAEFREKRDRPLLLLSYGAGAVGLNLQCANYVFLFDRWWNPAVEDQAIDRAHRVGQRNTVFVTRFLTPDTIEDRIAAVLARKREMFNSLIDEHDPLAGVGLSREDVFGLFDLQIRPQGNAGQPSALLRESL